MQDKRLAVVGVFVQEGAHNDAFTPVWDHLPADHNGTILTGVTVQVASLLPTDQTIYRYNGSLTTPPCSENVIWSVMQNPVEMSAEQIAAFTAIIEGNNRPLQPVNVRDLQLDATP
jgi:carbonic anhydrase